VHFESPETLDPHPLPSVRAKRRYDERNEHPHPAPSEQFPIRLTIVREFATAQVQRYGFRPGEGAATLNAM
jgi:hypothetical protein